MLHNSIKTGRLLNDGKYILFNSLIDRIVFFVAYLFLARTLPQQVYGLITAIFAASNILMTFLDFGLPAYLQREAAQAVGLKPKIKIAVLVRLVSIIVYLPLILLYFQNKLQDDALLVIIIALVNYVLGSAYMLNSVIIGKREYSTSSLYLFVSRMLLLVFFFSALFTGKSVEIFFVAFIFGGLIQIVFLYRKIACAGSIFSNVKVTREIVKSLFGSSLPMGLGLIFVMIYDRVDILIIQRIISLEAVALYAVAYAVYRALQIFGSLILVPAYTNFSQSYSLTKFINIGELKNVVLLLCIIAAALISGTYLFADAIIPMLFGDKYIESATVLKYLSIGLPGLYLNNLTGVISNSIGKEKIPVWGTGIGMIINVCLNIYLIGLIGILGAVITIVITEYIVFIIQLYQLIKLNFKRKFISAGISEG